MGGYNVKQKLGFLIFFAILMLVVVGGSGLVGAKRIESALNVMSEEKLPTANTLSSRREATVSRRSFAGCSGTAISSGPISDRRRCTRPA